MRSVLVLSLWLGLVCAAPAPRQAGSPTVTIDSGVVVGLQTTVANSPNAVNKFLGVPFAASPVRFSPPQTPTPWSEPYQATQNGPACIQVGTRGLEDRCLVTWIKQIATDCHLAIQLS